MDIEVGGAQLGHAEGNGADGCACVPLCQRIASLMRNRGGTSARTLTPTEGTEGLILLLVLGLTAGNTPGRGR